MQKVTEGKRNVNGCLLHLLQCCRLRRVCGELYAFLLVSIDDGRKEKIKIFAHAKCKSIREEGKKIWR